VSKHLGYFSSEADAAASVQGGNWKFTQIYIILRSQTTAEQSRAAMAEST
jgi:hypothetical protein